MASTEPLQVLDHQGGFHTPPPEWDKELAVLDAAAHQAMYRTMALTRAFDQQATALQRQGELALWAQSLGQEAAQVGSALALTQTDWAFPSYREHGGVAARGIDPLEILPLFRGSSHGGWDVQHSKCHLYTLVVGAQALHAVGYAQGLAMDVAAGQAEPGAVIVYLGDGATAQGDVNEALVFAATSNAPVVFFIQNNGWAISTPTSEHLPTPLARRGEGFGIEGCRIDGNDVLACRAATAVALDKARQGGGPTVIEAVTYRMGAHTTSDDPSRYRTSEHEQAWGQRDPLSRYRTYLTRKGLADDAFFAQTEAEGQDLAARARQHCSQLQSAPLTTAAALTYATPHAQVAEEMAWWEAYNQEGVLSEWPQAPAVVA
jgi:pyruvate dehydrogenase E1 component alpha subunit